MCLVQCDFESEKNIFTITTEQWWSKFSFQLLHNKGCNPETSERETISLRSPQRWLKVKSFLCGHLGKWKWSLQTSWKVKVVFTDILESESGLCRHLGKWKWSLQTSWGSCCCFSWWSTCQNQAPLEMVQVTWIDSNEDFSWFILSFPVPFPQVIHSSAVKIHASSLFPGHHPVASTRSGSEHHPSTRGLDCEAGTNNTFIFRSS